VILLPGWRRVSFFYAPFFLAVKDMTVFDVPVVDVTTAND
jgi:hypothetical protein